MNLGRKHELSAELYEHARFLKGCGWKSGNLIELARLLADHDIATLDELKDRIRK